MNSGEALALDRADLEQVVRLRFGPPPADVVRAIGALSDPDQIQRLILVAANAADLATFRRELALGPGAFRL